MKRLSLLIVLFLSAQIATAQNPRAVFKSLAENDIAASTEHFQKINDKTTVKMPEMCYLAEAALYNMRKAYQRDTQFRECREGVSQTRYLA